MTCPARGALLREVAGDDAGPLDPRLLELVPRLAQLAPPGQVIDKTRYSAFALSPLAPHLQDRGADALVVTGSETDVCVLATVLGAVDRGFGSSCATACAAAPTKAMTACSDLYASATAYRSRPPMRDGLAGMAMRFGGGSKCLRITGAEGSRSPPCSACRGGRSGHAFLLSFLERRRATCAEPAAQFRDAARAAGATRQMTLPIRPVGIMRWLLAAVASPIVARGESAVSQALSWSAVA